MQYGFRYTLESTSSQIVRFGSRSPKGLFYDLTINGTYYLGGDPWIPPGNCWLQYVRLYIDYVSTTPDEITSLALMDSGNNNLLNVRMRSS